jgi:hypothetical protein
VYGVCWDRDHNAILKDVPWSWLPRLFRGEAERTTPNLRSQNRSRTTETMQHDPIYLEPTWRYKGIASLCTSFFLPLTCSVRRSMVGSGEGRSSEPQCHIASLSRLHQHDTIRMDAYARSHVYRETASLGNLQMPIFPSSLPCPSYSLTSRT